MRFHIPTSIEVNSVDIVVDSGDSSRPEIDAIEEVTA